MSWFEDSNIKKSYIVQTVSDVGIFSACTQIYLTNISPCAGDTINITGNLGVSGNISGTTYFGDGSQLSGIVTTDNFVTGGVYSASSETLYFTGTTGFTPFSVDVSALLDDTNNYVTGGTYNPSTDTVTLTRNDNVSINITGVSNTFTTGATYDEGTELITFVRNDGNSYTADLAAIVSATTNSYTTGATLNGNIIEFANSVLGLDYYNVDLTPIVSGKVETTLFNTYTGDTETSLNGKLDTTSFNTYSGSVETQLNNKTENTNFTSHTGNTTIHYTKGSINLSDLGSSAHTHSISEVVNLQTELDTKVETTLFNTYTGDTETALGTKLPTTTFNSYTGSVVDVHVSSGNANAGTQQLSFTNTTGGTFNVTNSAALFSDNDVNVTGGTYDINTGCVTFTTNSGTTFDVCGFATGITDTFVTGGTLTGENLVLERNSGVDVGNIDLSGLVSGKLEISLFNTYTGDTQTALGNKTDNTNFVSHTGDTTIHYTKGSINLSELGSSAHTHSISEVVNLQTELDSKVSTTLFNTYTGDTETVLGTKVSTASNIGGGEGLFSGKSGTDLQFKSLTSTGGTVTISTTGATVNLESAADSNFYVTGFTYNDANTLTISRNGGLGDLSATINTLTGLTIDGVLSASTYTGITLTSLDDVTTGIPTTPNNSYQGRQLYFDVTSNEWIATQEYGSIGTVTIWGKKGSAGTIDKGCPVYITGFDDDIHEVELANASTGSTMPVIGFTAEDFDNAGVYPIVTFGKITGLDTTSTVSTLNPNGETWVVNDVLYTNTTDGGLTKNRPTGTNTQIQRIAKVLKINATSGQLFIFNTARTAGLPNLTTDYVWLGNGNDTPQEVIKTDLGVSVTGFSYDNNNTFTITDDNSGAYTATINQVSGLTVDGTLTLNNVGGTTPVTNLGIDSSGNVVSGSSVGSSYFQEGGASNNALLDTKGTHSITGTSGQSIIAGGNTNKIFNGTKNGIVGGQDLIMQNTTTKSFMGGGDDQTINNSDLSAMIGGYQNYMNGSANAIILAGQSNSIATSSDAATAGGVDLHMTSGDASFMGGGNTNTLTASEHSGVIGGQSHTMETTSNFSFMGAGRDNTMTSAQYGGILGGSGNTINGFARTFILGGLGVTASQDDTTYVPNLNIQTIGTGTSVNNLGIDSSGNVVSGTTGGDVSKVGTPVNNQIGVWTGDGTLEGDTGLTWNTAQIEVTDTDNNLTEIRADWVRVYNETDDANLFLYGYGTGHRGEIVLGAANGDRTTPTATLNGNNVATISAFGHSGTGFRQGGRISFAATENYTEGTNYGTRFVIQTVADGSTTLETRYATDGDGNHDFTGDVSITGDVGIGTTIPQEKLHVSTGNDLNSGNISFLIGGTAGTNARTGRIIKNTSSPYEMTIRASDFGTGNNLILNDTGGNVGIGTTSPTEALDVSGNTVMSGTLNIGTIGGTTSVTNLGIDASGNVVSGTTGGTSYWEETAGSIKLDTGETTRDVVEINTGGANTLSGTYSLGNLLVGDGNTFGNGQTVRRSFIGGNAVAVGVSEAFQTSIVFGQSLTVEGTSSSIFGSSHVAKGNYNFTAGQNNDLYGDNLTSIGTNNILGTSSVNVNRSIAIGEDVSSYADDQIVIGFGFDTNASWGAAKAIYVGIEDSRASSGWFSDPTIGSGTNFALGGNNTMRTDVGVIKAGAGRGILYLNNYTGSSVSEPTVDISDSVGLWAKNRDTGVTGLIVKAENGGKTWIGDRIGINTVTPTEALDVSGNTVMSGTLNIGSVGGTTPVTNLGVDSSGNVVSGSTISNTPVVSTYKIDSNADITLYSDSEISITWDVSQTDIDMEILTDPTTSQVHITKRNTSGSITAFDLVNADGISQIEPSMGNDDRVELNVFAPSDSAYPHYRISITRCNSLTYTNTPFLVIVEKWSSYS